MIIRVNDISESLRIMKAEEPTAGYPTLIEMQKEGICRFLSDLDLDFSAVREFDHIRVEGKVGVEVEMNCGRCLSTFKTPLRSVFTIFYTKSDKRDVQQQDEEVELAEKELVSAVYEGEEIDLTNEVTEHVVMELPLKPLCREECQGLCPKCGEDLNQKKCNCVEQKESFAFGALKNLKLER